MKTAMVIPTYWARASMEGHRPGDAVYDHPTPLDQEGTLARAIDSLNVLKNRDFSLVIIAAATADDIKDEVEERVKGIVREAKPPVETLVFSHSGLEKLRRLAKERIGAWALPLLSLRGYSNIRNLCLLLPHILGAEVVVLIDDDEVFEDPDFVDKALEFLGQDFNGKRVLAKAGYYIQPYGGYRLKKDFEPWMAAWDNLQRMNEAFDFFISQGPRLKRTPFVFGGNAVIHRDVFTRISFDPEITRGEDIDYLINAEIHGFNFYLDRELTIKHLPPPKPHPLWMRMREDIIRFLYEREKIRASGSLRPEDYDPYPGAFLKQDLEEKVLRASQLLAIQYLAEGRSEDAKETLANINLAWENPFRGKPVLKAYEEFRQKWEKLMDAVEQGREAFLGFLP